MTLANAFLQVVHISLLALGIVHHAYSDDQTAQFRELDLDYFAGKALFERHWVAAPASTIASDGLGPIYNARSCATCHPDNLRGQRPEQGLAPVALIMRVGQSTPVGSNAPVVHASSDDEHHDPLYGRQIQTQAIMGHRAEARVNISYKEVLVTFADGEQISLRKPTYHISHLAYGALAPETVLSPRIAPQLQGIGLLEAIDDRDIESLADQFDRDKDGISGRVNYLRTLANGQTIIGRFGYKANVATLAEQVQLAFLLDMGMSSRRFKAPWGDCTKQQAECRAAIHGLSKAEQARGDGEISTVVSDSIATYLRATAVETTTQSDNLMVVKGRQQFLAAGCAACHKEQFSVFQRGEEKVIYPYTDLLLHDMGEGLADSLAQGAASGREWRTAPLWAIARQREPDNRHYLHDGRARTLLEAVLWHGGEAETAKQAVLGMTKTQRQQLLAFLQSI